jgi:hypothetical protein
MSEIEENQKLLDFLGRENSFHPKHQKSVLQICCPGSGIMLFILCMQFSKWFVIAVLQLLETDVCLSRMAFGRGGYGGYPLVHLRDCLSMHVPQTISSSTHTQ